MVCYYSYDNMYIMNGVDFLNIQYLFYQIYVFANNFQDISFRTTIMNEHWPVWAMTSFIVSLFLSIIIIYYNNKIKEVRLMEEQVFGTIIPKTLADDSSAGNERWMRVLKHLETESQAEWRSAILEADIILDEMTRKMGYHGETLGERLKSVERSDFLTINQAWEAHKVRNMIAHDGADYILTKREVKRVVDLYRQVFEEFEFI